MEELLKSRGDSVGKGGDAISLGVFLAGVWQM